jgi:phage tail-like protein
MDLGGWMKCDGLTVNFKTYTYEPLGHNSFLPVLPDRITYEHITLTRPVNDIDTPKVMAWLGKRANKASGGTGGIAVLGTDFKPVMVWHLRGVYPTKWKGPGLDGGAKTIATETLELAHEGFLEV